MPSWLDTLDIADKVASVLGLLIAIIALVASIHFARKATRGRAPTPEPGKKPVNHQQPRPSKPQKPKAQPPDKPHSEPPTADRDYSTRRPLSREALEIAGLHFPSSSSSTPEESGHSPDPAVEDPPRHSP